MSTLLTNEVDHDHRAVFRMMLEIQRLLSVSDLTTVRDELLDALSALQDDALDHFAREEASLFPLLRGLSPTFESPIAELERGHDALAGVVQRMIHLVRVNIVDRNQLDALRQRLEREYEAHVHAEHQLLTESSKMLTTDQKVALAALMQKE